MNKIKELEQLLDVWKAAMEEHKRIGNLKPAKNIKIRMKGLSTAIAILKEPSNTQMHVDTKAPCDNCWYWKDKQGTKHCGDCGRLLSQ